MINSYHRLKKKPIDWEELQENNPEIFKLIMEQNQWSQYEQLPDLSEIPMEYQHMIPENIRKNKEDTRIQHIMLTK